MGVEEVADLTDSLRELVDCPDGHRAAADPRSASRPVRGQQVDDERRRNVEMPRSRAAGMAGLAIPHHATVITLSAVIRTKPLAPHLSIKFLETAHTHIHTVIAALSACAPSAKVITMLVFEENARAAFAFGGPWLVLIKSHGGASRYRQ